jgi:hypothetical protein
MPNNKVTLYTRATDGKYRKADPRGIYGKDTAFVLRFVGDNMKRTYETLPRGPDFATARRLCLEKELALSNPAQNTPSLKHPPKAHAVPADNGRVRIPDIIDAYVNALWSENNLRARTIKDKTQELRRWAEFMREERKKEFADEIDRADFLRFRDKMFNDGLAAWTVQTNKRSRT